MAIIAIVLSTAVGAIAGLFRLVFMEATAWQALATYLTVSAILCTAVVSSAVIMAYLMDRAGRAVDVPQGEPKTWHGWQADERPVANRFKPSGDRPLDLVAPEVPSRKLSLLRTD